MSMNEELKQTLKENSLEYYKNALETEKEKNTILLLPCFSKQFLL